MPSVERPASLTSPTTTTTTSTSSPSTHLNMDDSYDHDQYHFHDHDHDRAPSSTPTNSSTSNSNSNKPATSQTSVSADREKPRLTEQEKKNNHIASEQKRRAAIREGFDRLTELVPGLEGQGRSESIVLNKTVDFMRAQMREREELIAEIERNGGRVGEEFRT